MITLKYGGPDPLPRPAVSSTVKSAAMRHFHCSACQAPVGVDEDGCCRTCGGDTTPVQPSARPAAEKASPMGGHEGLSTTPEANPSTMVDVTEARMNLLQHIEGYTAEEEGLFLPDLDAYTVAVRAEAMDRLIVRITAKLTPTLNIGSAMDALIIVAAAVRELREERP